MPEPSNGTAANHELLISVAGKVDSLTIALEKSITHSAGEFDKLWKHVDARDERLTNAISTIGERVSNFGKPNISAIVSICVLIGSIALAFIAPIKTDIERQSKGAELMANAVLLRDERIAALQRADSEFREKQNAIREKVDEIAEHGSVSARINAAVLANDMLWMRGEKTMKQPDDRPHPNP